MPDELLGVIFSAFVFAAVAAGRSWLRARQTVRILGQQVQAAPSFAAIPDLAAAELRAPFLSRPSDHRLDLRSARAHAPTFDEVALTSEVWLAVQDALTKERIPALPFSDAARDLWLSRIQRKPTAGVVGAPDLVRVSADSHWVTADYEIRCVMDEGTRAVEWHDVWRMRAPNRAPLDFEVARIDDLYRGPPRGLGPPELRPAPVPEGRPTDLTPVVERILRALGTFEPDLPSELWSTALHAELVLRRRQGWTLPAFVLESVKEVARDDRSVEIWVEGTVGALRCGERWQLVGHAGGWQLASVRG